MPRNINVLTSELKSALTDAQKAAMSKSLDPSVVDESDNMEVMVRKVSAATADEFAKVLGPKLAKIIDDYITSQTFDISKLAAPNGPCTGVIVST